MGKGADTRERILDFAFRAAGRDGLEGLTLGSLAADLGLSKSGLFAHFRSKEDLQVEVLRAAAARFEDLVMRPAFRAPRGVPRIKKLVDNWLRWISNPSMPGGCIFVAAAVELDDREGRPREFLVAAQLGLRDAIVRAAQMAIDEGHFRKNLDCQQFAFELVSILLGYNHARRLLREPKAEARARAAFERLIGDATTRA
jgi:AcrR family transcriptional regulator